MLLMHESGDFGDFTALHLVKKKLGEKRQKKGG